MWLVEGKKGGLNKDLRGLASARLKEMELGALTHVHM
jgi:hypothetical protein